MNLRKLAVLTLALSLVWGGAERLNAQARAAVSAPMNARVFASIQSFAATPAGAAFFTSDARLVQLRGIASMSPSAPTLQLLGPLAAQLPKSFVVRVDAASVGAYSKAGIETMLTKAYADAETAALSDIDALAQSALAEAASDAKGIATLQEKISALRSYALYGATARDRATLFIQKAAEIRSMKAAAEMAEELSGGRGVESQGASVMVAGAVAPARSGLISSKLQTSDAPGQKSAAAIERLGDIAPVSPREELRWAGLDAPVRIVRNTRLSRNDIQIKRGSGWVPAGHQTYYAPNAEKTVDALRSLGQRDIQSDGLHFMRLNETPEAFPDGEFRQSLEKAYGVINQFRDKAEQDARKDRLSSKTEYGLIVDSNRQQIVGVYGDAGVYGSIVTGLFPARLTGRSRRRHWAP